MGGKITQTNSKIPKLNDNYNVPQNAEPTPQPKWEVYKSARFKQNHNKHQNHEIWCKNKLRERLRKKHTNRYQPKKLRAQH